LAYAGDQIVSRKALTLGLGGVEDHAVGLVAGDAGVRLSEDVEAGVGHTGGGTALADGVVDSTDFEKSEVQLESHVGGRVAGENYGDNDSGGSRGDVPA
jgi:hypothetical protein